MDFTSIIVRSAVAYVFLLVLMRLSGKRAIRQGSAMDLVTALILGELVDKVLTGKVDVPQYICASLVVFWVHVCVEYLVFRSGVAGGWLVGREEPVIESGQLMRQGMRSERLNGRSVKAALRTLGIRDMREVKAADVEIDGTISALREDWAREAQKQDGGRLPRKLRRDDSVDS